MILRTRHLAEARVNQSSVAILGDVLVSKDRWVKSHVLRSLEVETPKREGIIPDSKVSNTMGKPKQKVTEELALNK
jgi:hypothetical protein